MARSFKILGLIVLTFLIVWAIVIIQWQQTRRMPDTRDIVLYLVALPIGLLLMFWGLKTGIDRMRQPPPAVEASADPQAAATEQAQAAQARERTLTARVLAQAVALPAGADAAAAIEALRDPGTRPELDKEFTNADGFPIAVARLQDIAPDDEALRDELDALSPGLAWQPTTVRAVAALDTVLMQALDLVNAALPEPPDEALPRARRPEPLTLRVTTFVSNDRMPENERQLLARWVLQRCVGALDERRARAQVSVAPVRNGTDALLAIDRWIVNAHKREEQEVLLALAADSLVAQHTIDELAAQHALFGPEQSNGRVPGEAAAALAIARPEAALQWPELDVRLHRIGLGKRDKSADASGRIAADLHATLARQCLEVAQVQGSDIKLVYTDIDHRASRGVELGALMNELLPELDPIEDRCALGVGCGDTGAAAGLATLALATAAALDNEEPALVLSSFDAFDRAATLVRRMPPPPPAAT